MTAEPGPSSFCACRYVTAVIQEPESETIRRPVCENGCPSLRQKRAELQKSAADLHPLAGSPGLPTQTAASFAWATHVLATPAPRHGPWAGLHAGDDPGFCATSGLTVVARRNLGGRRPEFRGK